MIANYGYRDGSGDFFITIDTEKCDGCADCVRACPVGIFVVGEDPNDPLRDDPVAFVGDEQRKQLKYACAACKPDRDRPALACTVACNAQAIAHSW